MDAEQPVEVVRKKVKAPLSPEELKDVFHKKGAIKYIIDYANSSIKGDILLTYLANLEIEPEFDLTGTTTKDKLDLLLTYMKLKNINESAELANAVASILLRTKGINPKYILEPTIINDAESLEFVAKNPQIVAKWSNFIDSILIFLVRVFEPQVSLDEYADVNEVGFVGLNVVNVLKVPGFFEAFVSKPSAEPLKWYKVQFEDNCFKGKSLIQYILEMKNSVVLGLEAMSNGRFTPEAVAHLQDDLTQIETQLGIECIGEMIVPNEAPSI